MNIFRLLADFSHLASIFILLQKMKSSSSCSGLSFKSQALYLMVFVTRYLDLFWAFTDSFYNTTFKILFIGSSAYIIYLMLNDYKPTHDPNTDTFKVQYLLGFSALLALLFPHDYSVSEILWTFSIWLESSHFQPIPVVAGIIQTLLYSDFFYIYYTKVMKGKKFSLPV
ncbi:hypothetical protein ASPNIDRAFT_56861 [Aspergillus niger ATCC 1015]|uniref:ER lumen protein-retaining receptor n=1 Tax=Aspergillus niger (strain ATCC 1015 / CBS 113.46 / FGSC A1144 / LSHB Ac4 / NCTC 3858a / NRRL 328 / USDA 3528.7) TaxID=380704 RepID=G3XLW8_ASPNA|nr:hypothetical protein ASPNIDRAFT_56861 [Aspergillus niger ATCC 1015]